MVERDNNSKVIKQKLKDAGYASDIKVKTCVRLLVAKFPARQPSYRKEMAEQGCIHEENTVSRGKRYEILSLSSALVSTRTFHCQDYLEVATGSLGNVVPALCSHSKE